MIADQDIHDAIAQQVESLGYDLHFEGQGDVPKRPFLALQLVPALVTKKTLAGTSPVHTGYLQASVAVAGGAGPNIGASARRIADEITALFPGFPMLPITGATVTVTKVEGKSGYPDGVGYRIPVQIHYRATRT